jgi:hypothetical protein
LNKQSSVNGIKHYPDFYIVGAPKCGTTALANYLEQSDSIFFHRKEIHYFGTDLKFNRPRVDLETYNQKTKELGEKGLVGDASVYYLASSTAALEIYKTNPEAKIIICLRNPVDFMLSLHAQLLSNVDENERDFKTALKLEPSRNLGKNIPWYAHPVHALFYRKMAGFSEQVKRYLDLFDAKNVKIVLLDDLANNTFETVKDVYAFLETDPPKDLNLSIVNPTTDVRFKWIKVLHKSVFPADGKLRKAMPRFLMSLIDFMFFRVMTKKAQKQVIDTEFKEVLQIEFATEVAELAEVIDRNLDHWQSNNVT